MRTDLINVSTAYLVGWKTIIDCAEWLAGIDWDDPSLDPDSLKVVGLLELLATEVTEGLRPEADFRQEVAKFVANETTSLYTIQTTSGVASSSNDVADWPPALTLQAV